MKLYIFILCPMPLLGQGQYHLYRFCIKRIIIIMNNVAAV